MLLWGWYGFHKKPTRTHYVELVFLLLMGYAGHIVHYGASGARNVDALFFMVRWDLYGFDKKRTATRYADLVFLHPVGSVGHVAFWCVRCVKH
jgi:hypothetical protein